VRLVRGHLKEHEEAGRMAPTRKKRNAFFVGKYKGRLIRRWDVG
jgi:hypothetical protein